METWEPTVRRAGLCRPGSLGDRGRRAGRLTRDVGKTRVPAVWSLHPCVSVTVLDAPAHTRPAPTGLSNTCLCPTKVPASDAFHAEGICGPGCWPSRPPMKDEFISCTFKWEGLCPFSLTHCSWAG